MIRKRCVNRKWKRISGFLGLVASSKEHIYYFKKNKVPV
jgi:hypothetical protein